MDRQVHEVIDPMQLADMAWVGQPVAQRRRLLQQQQEQQATATAGAALTSTDATAQPAPADDLGSSSVYLRRLQSHMQQRRHSTLLARAWRASSSAAVPQTAERRPRTWQQSLKDLAAAGTTAGAQMYATQTGQNEAGALGSTALRLPRKGAGQTVDVQAPPAAAAAARPPASSAYVHGEQEIAKALLPLAPGPVVEAPAEAAQQERGAAPAAAAAAAGASLPQAAPVAGVIPTGIQQVDKESMGQEAGEAVSVQGKQRLDNSDPLFQAGYASMLASQPLQWYLGAQGVNATGAWELNTGGLRHCGRACMRSSIMRLPLNV